MWVVGGGYGHGIWDMEFAVCVDGTTGACVVGARGGWVGVGMMRWAD